MIARRIFKDMNDEQQHVFIFLLKKVEPDGEDLVEWLQHVQSGDDSVDTATFHSYQRLTPVEFLEVVHFVTKHLLKL